MSVKSWNVTTEAGTHRVDLDWTYLGGRRVVRVDGAVVDESTKIMRYLSRQEFEVDGHRFEVVTEPAEQRRFTPKFHIWLKVDGELVDPETAPDRWESKKAVAA